MRLILAAVLFLCSVATSAQLAIVGRDDPNYCANLRVKPNLHLPASLKLKGKVTDQTGVPFKNSPVTLRRYVSETEQTTIAKATTDSEGNFSLGTVGKGEYRLLASSTRAFKQPAEMWCRPDVECVLEITIEVNPTDLPDSQCPIK